MTSVMLRTRAWDVELVNWAEHMRGLPFAWGATDCWELLRDAQTIVWGVDRLEEFPTVYSAADAKAAVRRHGGMAVVLRKAGAVWLPRELARSGDVLIDPEAHDGLGAAAIVIGATQVVSVGPDGLVEVTPLRDVPLSYTAWGWRR